MPLRPLKDQTPNFTTLLAQLYEGEVLLARPENYISKKPNAGAPLRNQKAFDVFMSEASLQGVNITFFAIPASELLARRRRGSGPGSRRRR